MVFDTLLVVVKVHEMIEIDSNNQIRMFFSMINFRGKSSRETNSLHKFMKCLSKDFSST